MARKLQIVNDTLRRRGGPITRLASTVNGPERDMLVVLRRKLAAQIDEGCGPAQLAALVRQFRDVDTQLRGLDLQAAQLAADVAEDGEDGDGSAAWDESAL